MRKKAILLCLAVIGVTAAILGWGFFRNFSNRRAAWKCKRRSIPRTRGATAWSTVLGWALWQVLRNAKA